MPNQPWEGALLRQRDNLKAYRSGARAGMQLCFVSRLPWTQTFRMLPMPKQGKSDKLKPLFHFPDTQRKERTLETVTE